MPKEIMPHRSTVADVKSIGLPRRILMLDTTKLSLEEMGEFLTLMEAQTYKDRLHWGKVEESHELPPASFTEEAAMENVETMLESVGDQLPIAPLEIEPATQAEHDLVHQAVEGIGLEKATEAVVDGVTETLGHTLLQAKIDTGNIQWVFARTRLVPEEAVTLLVSRFERDLEHLNEEYSNTEECDNAETATDVPKAVWPFPSGSLQSQLAVNAEFRASEASDDGAELSSIHPDFSATGKEVPLSFRVELIALINQHSIENSLGMPDHIIADLMCNHLNVMAEAVWRTEQWKR